MKQKAFFLLAALVVCFFAKAQAPKTYLLKVGKLYDSEKNTFLTNQEILVSGKKIVKVGTGLSAAGAEVINLKNCTVSPGLIDAHTHILTIQKPSDPLETDVLANSDIERSLRAVEIARSFLEAGYTTIRDLGNSGMFLDLNIKRAINKGWVRAAPNMLVSGPILSPEDGQFFNLSSQNRPVIDREYRVIKNAEDARQAVKDHISQGVDVIKVVMGDGRLTLTLPEVKAIVETAHSYGMKVTAHATYDAVIARALDAGVDGIEHGYGIADSLLDRMAAQKVYLVPTIGTADEMINLFDPDKKQSKEQQNWFREFASSSELIVKKAIEKGVMVVNGSDMYIHTPRPQGDAAKNSIEAYYEGTRKANDVLKTATRNAAIACGLETKTGTIREGMAADIVAFDGDMEKEFVQALYKIKFVMKNGEIFINK